MNLTKNKLLTRSRQGGVGKWGWLFTVIILVVAGTGALRLGPHYIDFNMIKGIVDRLPQEQVHSMSRAEIREVFEKQFRVENFSHNVKDVMDIQRSSENTTITIAYEVREHLFYNIDVVLNFKEENSFE